MPSGYVINVGSAQNGIGYGRCVHIDGFSEAIVDFILEHERQTLSREKFKATHSSAKILACVRPFVRLHQVQRLSGAPVGPVQCLDPCHVRRA